MLLLIKRNVNFISRQFEYLRKTGNREEVANCRKVDEKLIGSLEACANGSFKLWKNKVTYRWEVKLMYS